MHFFRYSSTERDLYDHPKIVLSVVTDSGKILHYRIPLENFQSIEEFNESMSEQITKMKGLK